MSFLGYLYILCPSIPILNLIYPNILDIQVYYVFNIYFAYSLNAVIVSLWNNVWETNVITVKNLLCERAKFLKK